MSYRLKRFVRGFRMRFLREIFYEHNLESIPRYKSKIAMSIKIIDKDDILRINEVRNFSLRTLEKRLVNGDKCFVTEKESRFMSFHWLQTKGKHYVQPIGEWVEINDGEAVIYHVHVHNDFRGNRINGFVYSEILKYCKVNKINRVWIYTDKKNINNRKGLESLGFKIYKESLSLLFNNRYHQLNVKLY